MIKKITLTTTIPLYVQCPYLSMEKDIEEYNLSIEDSHAEKVIELKENQNLLLLRNKNNQKDTSVRRPSTCWHHRIS